MEKQMRKVAKEEVGKHVKAMHKGKAFKKGGKTDADMLKYGRGMAKVMNQKVKP